MTERSALLEYCDPLEWRQHRFGLPLDRWQSLAGKTVIVTGAGSGFGRAITLGLTAAGCSTYALGRRESNLVETKQRASEQGLDAALIRIHPLDLRIPEAITRFAAYLDKAAIPVHGLVNNAASPNTRGYRFPLRDASLADWHSLLDTNVRGPWLLTRALLPRLAAESGGRIIFVSSEAGWADQAGMGIYNLSKCALNSLSFCLAAEAEQSYPGLDLQINTIVPGEAKTEMNLASSASPDTVVSAILALLSHPPSGPNGRFFHRDGRHLSFGYARPWPHSLLKPS